MERGKQSEHGRTNLPGFGERLACIVLLMSGVALALCLLLIVAGSMLQLENSGLLASAVSDDWALFWITLGSTLHLVFVPALCVFIALRDRRRKDMGIPIPGPRSVWSGHESVFGDAADRLRSCPPQRGPYPG